MKNSENQNPFLIQTVIKKCGIKTAQAAQTHFLFKMCFSPQACKGSELRRTFPGLVQAVGYHQLQTRETSGTMQNSSPVCSVE